MLQRDDIARLMKNRSDKAISLLLGLLPLRREYFHGRKKIIMAQTLLTAIVEEKRAGCLSFDNYLTYKSRIDKALLKTMY